MTSAAALRKSMNEGGAAASFCAGQASFAARPQTGRSPDSTRAQYPAFVIFTALIALAIKVVIALNTIGTNDVVTFYRFGQQLLHHGLEYSYRHDIAFNHPPLTAYYLETIYELDTDGVLRSFKINFPFLLRFPGILSDFIVVLLLLQLNAKQGRLPFWLLALFAISPVSIMVSGFHGNTDPVMVMFLVAASYMAAKERPVLCALLFALSCQVKIVPLLLLPIPFFFWLHRKRATRFAVTFSVVMVALWAEPLLHFPAPFLKSVLGYGSWWGIWGITYWLRLTGLEAFSPVTFLNFTPPQAFVTNTLKAVIMLSIPLLAWRRRALSSEHFFASMGYAWLTFFAFSPGVCAQYMIWPAAFLLFTSPAIYLWTTGTSSLFLFFFYNITAAGLPWMFANSTARLNTVWTPWSVWPWLAILGSLAICYRQLKSVHPALRLVSFQTAP